MKPGIDPKSIALGITCSALCFCSAYYADGYANGGEWSELALALSFGLSALHYSFLNFLNSYKKEK